MTKELWINLPVKDVNKSKAFFTALGFKQNLNFAAGPDTACFLIGSKNFVLMLFGEDQFKHFTKNDLPDTKKFTEVLFSIDAETKEEVDEMAEKAAASGGDVFAKPAESQGWMYGCAFADPDGHRWNVLYMDMSKMPAK